MKKATIMCVDDDSHVLAMMVSLLQEHDYDVIGAKDGLQAKALFHQLESELACILLDIRMPKLDGIGLAKEIRKTSDIPIIAVSAYLADEGVMNDCEQAGVTAYARKPFAVEPLLSMIGKQTQKHTSKDQ